MYLFIALDAPLGREEDEMNERLWLKWVKELRTSLI